MEAELQPTVDWNSGNFYSVISEFHPPAAAVQEIPWNKDILLVPTPGLHYRTSAGGIIGVVSFLRGWYTETRQSTITYSGTSALN